MGKQRAAVTERDIEIVRWLGRHRLATAEQVAKRFGMHRSKSYQRLKVAVDAGLVRHELGVRSCRLYLATRAGLSLAGLDLPVATVSAASCAHDLALVDIAILLEMQPNRRLISERELRRSDEDAVRRLQLKTFNNGDEPRAQWPDMVVVDYEKRTITAFEIELSLKKSSRIQDKLRAYQTSPFHRIEYICGQEGILKSVRREAQSAGLGDRIVLSRFLAVQPLVR